ncbi:MAG: hypothetical protein Q7J69_06380 [Candidatus Omnitrophota bacterium]|nr:hypothetical protein [Candidatus Omnitrophota bacterium]
MTAVARIAIEECPMLLADLLLSGQPLPGVIAAVPTADDLSTVFPPGETRVPRGLCQKIAIVGDNLMLGWTGPCDIVHDVISGLVRQSAAQPFTNDTLRRYFDGLNQSVWKEIGLVGFIRDPDRRIAQFGRSYLELSTELFGRVGLLGSGHGDFEKFFRHAQQLPKADNIVMNALQRSISFGLHMSGSLLRFELATPASLKKFYGGGYEIAVSESGKFKKLDDVTYAFWWIKAVGPKLRGNLLPSKVFRYSYKDDLLIIRSVAFDGSAPRAAAREQLFRVPPVYRDLRPDEETGTALPPLNSRWLCNYFLVHFADGRVAIFTKVFHQPQEKQWVRFEDVPGGVTVAVSQKFLEEISREVLHESGVLDKKVVH